MAFATHADLANRLGVDLTPGEQTDATALLALAQALIQSEADQIIEAVDADTLTRPGTWSETLRLPERPVVAVASVTADNSLVDTETWYLDGDTLVRPPGWYGPNVELEVVYDHGYTTIPGVIKVVCLEVVVRAWVNPGAVQTEQYGSEQIVYGDYRSRGGMLLTEVERDAIRAAVRLTAGTVVLR